MLEDESAEIEPAFQPVKTEKTSKTAAPHKGKGAGDAPRAPRAAAATNAAPAAQEEASAPRRRDDRSSGPRSGGKGKGSKGGSRPAKHDHDRQSFQRREGEKRSENGPGSWGKPEEVGAPVDSVEGEEAKPAREPREPRPLTAEQEEAAALARKEREEEEKQMTLEEYRRRAAAAPATRELPKARQPNEGVDDKQFKKAQLLTKETEDFYSGKKTEAKPKAAKQKKEAEKIAFEPKPYSPRDDRPPRDGGKGGKGGRAPRSSVPPPPVVNEEAFPTLGKK